jgi:hypothetical protein
MTLGDYGRGLTSPARAYQAALRGFYGSGQHRRGERAT